MSRALKSAIPFTAIVIATSLSSTLTVASDLTVASYGGSYQRAQSQALFKPAAAALGFDVKEVTYSGMSTVRLQVKTATVTMDIVASGSGSAARAGVEGLLQPLDYDLIDVSHFDPALKTRYCVGADVFSTVMAWNTETYGEAGPQTWADFWDVEKFPGRRAYRGSLAGALEPALMADGVPLEQVYEVLSSDAGIKRALDKIRELKPHIDVWWSSGAQHAQLMKDGEVDMTTGWNGRFHNAAKDGARVAYTYNQALLDYDCFAVPKGAPNKDRAMRFLAEISKAKYQVNLPAYINYGPTNKQAFSIGKIDEAVARLLPSHPDNAALQLPIDIAWYGEFEKRASAAFQDMLTE